ncbi:HIT family protein [Massilia sp. TWR1-2-2]|uniref:HIT family protein n=1 Tax=Massilia sp. TWR1-2-2 TaxID=2804584 RepID=UPI003CF8CB54
MTDAAHQCDLCDLKVEPIFRTDQLSVIPVDDAAYPGFCRVVWNDHVKEMSDLAPDDRMALMDAVCNVEQAMRSVMVPDKINLASLGNMTPHLHWHVIPRYAGDAHFPNPVWSEAVLRTTDEPVLAARRALLPKLNAEIVRRMSE